MKTPARTLTALVLSIGALAAGFAHAQTKPGTAPTLKGTLVEGTVLLPSGGAFGNIKCSQLKVIAESKEMVQLKPFGMAHKWTKEAQMTGTAPSCAYSLPVPPGSEFSLRVVGSVPGCSMVNATLAGSAGPMKVEKGTTKTKNLEVTALKCGVPG